MSVARRVREWNLSMPLVYPGDSLMQYLVEEAVMVRWDAVRALRELDAQQEERTTHAKAEATRMLDAARG